MISLLPEHHLAYLSEFFFTGNPDPEVLHPEELEICKTFAPKRQGYFMAGRYAAKMATKQLGVSNLVLLPGKNNEPLWPEGFCGSISHTDGFTGSLVAKKESVKSVGLDIELVNRVKPEMWHLVFVPSEIKMLETATDMDQQELATLLFSMKEAFYKLQFPLTGERLWFHDVAVEQTTSGYSACILKNSKAKSLLPEHTPLYAIRYQDFAITYTYLTL